MSTNNAVTTGSYGDFLLEKSGLDKEQDFRVSESDGEIAISYGKSSVNPQLSSAFSSLRKTAGLTLTRKLCR
jgi:hypothetical protein